MLNLSSRRYILQIVDPMTLCYPFHAKLERSPLHIASLSQLAKIVSLHPENPGDLAHIGIVMCVNRSRDIGPIMGSICVVIIVDPGDWPGLKI